MLINPFLEKLDSIDTVSSKIPYFEDNKGDVFLIPNTGKSTNLSYLKELPAGDNSSVLTNIGAFLNFDSSKKIQ